ncbi:MAG: metallophosphoesterase [Actinomycetota bacterium]|nr:metallophosphoesterase [Actinomycetota bacterium]
MGNWQVLGGVGASKRLATEVIVATIAILIAAGCGPEKTPPPEVAGPPVVVAAGDIASCGTESDDATAELVGGLEGTVLTLGDNTYPDGSAENYDECYEPTWGQFKERTRPAPGNHEYETGGASAYFDYFGKAAGDPDKGYYSYDLGSWHVVALNSNCGEGELRCGPGSPQGRWLKEDLAANDEDACTLAYFHHPLFASGSYRPGIARVGRLWETLYAAGVDVVLNGHDHNYQRFAPQDPWGRANPEGGIRQFVVGTGGRSLYEISVPIANTEVHNDDAYGVLKLTLHPKKYEWEFVPVEGETFSDSGGARCH